MGQRSLFTKNACGEDELLRSINMDEAWALIERFSTLNRHSGDPDEYVATEYLRSRLSDLGIPFVNHKAHLYLSVPRSASVTIGNDKYYAKTASFSLCTGPEGVSAPLVYVPEQSDQEFKDKVSGKIVVTQWPSAAEVVVYELMQAGAVGVIFIQPGELIHEDTCTTIWGNPEIDSSVRIPKIAVTNVSKSNGDKILNTLRDQCQISATLVTQVETGWKDTDIVVADIPGSTYPDEFVLLHGHLDSWHAGIGDNAVGNGAMLEIARVLWQIKKDLKRSVRIAWWTGHSTGRYAGSTWFADNYAIDLVENCVANMNCDSPGCRWATDLTGVPSMAELVEFTKQAVKDISGQEANPARPHRAGDYAFLNLGLSSTMMLSSKIPDEVKKEKGLHGVGGCGGNNEWHTEKDDMEIADKELLLRDTRLYALMTYRLANLDVHPMDYSKTASEIGWFAQEYQDVVGDRVDLTGIIEATDVLSKKLSDFYDLLEKDEFDDSVLEEVNRIQRKIARELVEIDYTREGKFHQDPATPLNPVPDLAYAKVLSQSIKDSDEEGFAEVSLIRGKNRVLYKLKKAMELVDKGMELLR